MFVFVLAQTTVPNPNFWDLRFGNILTLLGLALAYWRFRSHQHKMDETAIKQQATWHSENRQRLDMLLEFQKTQLELNVKYNDQLTELRVQTSRITQMAEGLDRRLMLQESRHKS